MTHSNSSIINRCDKEKHFAGKQILVLAFQMIIIKTNEIRVFGNTKTHPVSLTTIYLLCSHIFLRAMLRKCLENVNPLVYGLYFVPAIGNLVFLYSNCCVLGK